MLSAVGTIGMIYVTKIKTNLARKIRMMANVIKKYKLVNILGEWKRVSGAGIVMRLYILILQQILNVKKQYRAIALLIAKV